MTDIVQRLLTENTMYGYYDSPAIQSEAADEIIRLREALRWYADQRNYFPVERRSPGDPDPAVVFVEEPPIMRDGGKRAREALEVKP